MLFGSCGIYRKRARRSEGSAVKARPENTQEHKQPSPSAAEAARYTENLSLERYKQGAIGYLDVVVAQTASLQAQRAVLDLQTRQLSANIGLVKALGGGWSRAEALSMNR